MQEEKDDDTLVKRIDTIVFLILMSGLMVWGVGSMSKAVKREHSGSEYFNVTPIVYHPRTIKACLLGAMALGVVTWAIRP